MKKILIFILSLGLITTISLYDSKASLVIPVNYDGKTVVETFDDIDLTTGYASGSYIGTDMIVYNYRGAGRTETDNNTELDGNGIVLRGSSSVGTDSSGSIEFTVTQGLERLQFQYRKAYTSAGARRFAVRVVQGTNVLDFTLPDFGTSQGADNTIYTFDEYIGFNRDDLVHVSIYNINTTQTARQATFDNIVITYAGLQGRNVIGSLSYLQQTSTDYTVSFSLPTHNTSTTSLGDILSNVSDAFSGSGIAIYTVRQPSNVTYEYELRNSFYDIIEIMPEFDTILFLTDTDEMAILLNGNVVKYYNNSVGIEMMTLRYTGFPNQEYQDGYLDGLHDGRLDGLQQGYMDGYSDARRELWTSRYELGYNEARNDYGYFNTDTNEWVTASVRYLDGYNEGLRVNNSDAYDAGFDAGYREGSTDSFSAKLSDWIVPAIVIVLFLGGVIVILNRRLGGSND